MHDIHVAAHIHFWWPHPWQYKAELIIHPPHSVVMSCGHDVVPPSPLHSSHWAGVLTRQVILFPFTSLSSCLIETWQWFAWFNTFWGFEGSKIQPLRAARLQVKSWREKETWSESFSISVGSEKVQFETFFRFLNPYLNTQHQSGKSCSFVSFYSNYRAFSFQLKKITDTNSNRKNKWYLITKKLCCLVLKNIFLISII